VGETPALLEFVILRGAKRSRRIHKNHFTQSREKRKPPFEKGVPAEGGRGFVSYLPSREGELYALEPKTP